MSLRIFAVADLNIPGPNTDTLVATWYGTGNNVAVAADTTRRIIRIRLDVLEEHPENRSDFRHPDLISWLTPASAGQNWRTRFARCGRGRSPTRWGRNKLRIPDTPRNFASGPSSESSRRTASNRSWPKSKRRWRTTL